ncbi:branched-chain amino acid ABC transporter permease [Cryobacterium levicorallinum]|uniref:Branched-chain amino acid transport system permease protein n=2 Tax=Cryobacterium levicorallinum TaxID=995038 RepID=A0ABY1EI47_9MICO|nr:branched-chain amino acid ABC transporter permease [Cryobacterium levicorallinum]GEP28579.1 amino acid ABC transporter permease [Cryobacterium levicorallinum]SFH94350.1 branched-chain amino acid transport system permease protein [Cryobacterium levicorallinum]
MTALGVAAPERLADLKRRLPTGARLHFSVLALVLVVMAFLPLVVPESALPVAIRTLIFAIMAVGWNLMSGYGGMFSFGHAAFFGVGAYTNAYLLTAFGVSPWIGMIVGAGLSAGVGVLIAYLCLKYKLAGSYFALATFAFAQMFLLVTLNMEFLNKSEGINIPLLPEESWSMLQFDQGSLYYYWIPLVLLGVAVAVSISFVYSRPGQFAQAIRDDPTAAESLGIKVMKYRLIPVALSCAVTAVAGAFYTQYYLFIGPDQAFGLHVSTDAIIPAVIGGIGTIWGPLIGAAVIGPLSAVVAGFLRDPPPFLEFLYGTSGLDIAIYAILLILIVVFLPKGIYGTIRERRRK